jgi:hypothetical protein
MIEKAKLGEPVTTDLLDGSAEMLTQRWPGLPGTVLLGIAHLSEGAVMVEMTIDQALKLSAALARTAGQL